MRFIIGNWKMHGTKALCHDMAAVAHSNSLNVIVCPPFTHLDTLNTALKGKKAVLGAQDMSAESLSARTGDIAGEMLVELGAKYVIIGHSERRQYHQEEDTAIAQKCVRAAQLGLTPILCVGESLASREAGKVEEVVRGQLDKVRCALPGGTLIVAYEPIWAIGTGRAATQEDAAAAAHIIRAALIGCKADAVFVLYGGSVKPDNVLGFLTAPGINGVLVGGASLVPEQFAALIKAAE